MGVVGKVRETERYSSVSVWSLLIRLCCPPVKSPLLGRAFVGYAKSDWEWDAPTCGGHSSSHRPEWNGRRLSRRNWRANSLKKRERRYVATDAKNCWGDQDVTTRVRLAEGKKAKRWRWDQSLKRGRGRWKKKKDREKITLNCLSSRQTASKLPFNIYWCRCQWCW